MIIFLVLFGFQVLNLENKLIQNNKITINKSEPFNIFNIYNYNVDKMKYTIPTFDREEIAIIKEIKDDYALIKDKEFYLFEYYNNNINTMQNDDTLFCKTKGNTGRDRWVYSITKNGNNLTNALTNDKITTVEKFMENSKYHYFVLLKNDYGGEYDKVQDEVKRYNLKILIQNSAGMILEKQDLAE